MSMIGDNSKDITLATQAREDAVDQFADNIRLAQRKLDSYGRVPEKLDLDSSIAATDLIAQIKAVLEQMRQIRGQLVTPYNDAVSAIDAHVIGIRDELVEAEQEITARLNQYQRDQDALAKAQKLEQAQQTIDDPMPGASRPPVKRARSTVISTGGAKATLRDKTVIQITDVKLLPERYLNRPAVREALRKEMQRDVEKGDRFDGIMVTTEKQTQIRQ